MTVLWRKFLERFFTRVWFPKFKRKKDRISEELLETTIEEERHKTKAPARKGQGLTF
ncbi:MAG: hypothetical protein ABFD62_18135 [Syntrophaceae bacterium]